MKSLLMILILITSGTAFADQKVIKSDDCRANIQVRVTLDGKVINTKPVKDFFSAKLLENDFILTEADVPLKFKFSMELVEGIITPDACTLKMEIFDGSGLVELKSSYSTNLWGDVECDADKLILNSIPYCVRP